MSNEATQRPASEVFGPLAEAMGWRSVDTVSDDRGLVRARIVGSSYETITSIGRDAETALARAKDMAIDVAASRLKEQRFLAEEAVSTAKARLAVVISAEEAFALHSSR